MHASTSKGSDEGSAAPQLSGCLSKRQSVTGASRPGHKTRHGLFCNFCMQQREDFFWGGLSKHWLPLTLLILDVLKFFHRIPFLLNTSCYPHATLAMRFIMSLTDVFRRTEDDGNDSYASDTPRSGIATPQPDPSDKRLPGIMHSYFGQVGAGSSQSPNSGALETPAVESEAQTPLPPFHRRETTDGDQVLSSVTPDSHNEPASASHDKDPMAQPPTESERSESLAPKNTRTSGLHPYPTPPVSQPPSLHKLKLSDSGSEDEKEVAKEAASLPSAHHKRISESIPSSARRASLMNPLSSVVTASNVHAAHFSNPSDRSPPATPSRSRLTSEFHDSPSVDRLKKLTDDASKKSIPPTPTRALSNQTVKSDASGGSDPVNGANGQNGKAVPESTLTTSSSSSGSTGAPAPAPKGKLTVKISEARGLRKSRDPYVVAVFQRNELVSKGPLPDDGDDNEDATSSPAMGGIPITRSGSDSGRPMAIPMKSRQSSNTSLSDYRDFKFKGRKSMTNPKWDTEAIL